MSKFTEVEAEIIAAIVAMGGEATRAKLFAVLVFGIADTGERELKASRVDRALVSLLAAQKLTRLRKGHYSIALLPELSPKVLRLDIWSGYHSLDHIARSHHSINDLVWPLVRRELEGGALVNLRMLGPEEGWGPSEDFDLRRARKAGHA